MEPPWHHKVSNMDITLADYIKRTMEQLEKDKTKPEQPKQEDQYLVYPEDDGYDRPVNPFSQV